MTFDQVYYGLVQSDAIVAVVCLLIFWGQKNATARWLGVVFLGIISMRFAEYAFLYDRIGWWRIFRAGASVVNWAFLLYLVWNRRHL